MLTFFNVVATLGLFIVIAQLVLMKFYPTHRYGKAALHGYVVTRKAWPWWTSKTVMTTNNIAWFAFTLFMGWDYLAVTAVIGGVVSHLISLHLDTRGIFAQTA